MKREREAMTSRYLQWHAQSVNRGPRTRAELGSREFKNFRRIIGWYDSNRKDLKDMSLLDVGSADDHFVNAVGERMCASSISGEGINLDVDRMPFADESFDIVTSFACIEHIKNTEYFLAEMYRVLKNSGLVFITTPNWRYCYKSFFDEPTHYTPFTPERLRAVLSISGFQNVSIYPGLRLKPKIMYTMRGNYFVAAALPFRGDSILRHVLPILCGRSTSVIAVGIKDRNEGPSN